jgi:hypothetical protein
MEFSIFMKYDYPFLSHVIIAFCVTNLTAISRLSPSIHKIHGEMEAETEERQRGRDIEGKR